MSETDDLLQDILEGLSERSTAATHTSVPYNHQHQHLQQHHSQHVLHPGGPGRARVPATTKHPDNPSIAQHVPGGVVRDRVIKTPQSPPSMNDITRPAAVSTFVPFNTDFTEHQAVSYVPTGRGRGRQALHYQPYNLPDASNPSRPHLGYTVAQKYAHNENPDETLMRKKPSQDGTRDRSPMKGVPTTRPTLREEWHRQPGPRDIEPSLHRTGYVATKPSFGLNPVVPDDLKATAYRVAKMKQTGEWDVARRPMGHRGTQEDIIARNQQAMTDLVDSMRISMDQDRRLIIDAPFFDQNESLEEEYEEEQLDEEYDDYDDYDDPPQDDVDYHNEMMLFRRRMAAYRREKPKEYPQYLQQVLDADLPREHHEHFRREMAEITANGGFVPEYKKKRTHGKADKHSKKDKKDKKNKKEKKKEKKHKRTDSSDRGSTILSNIRKSLGSNGFGMGGPTDDDGKETCPHPECKEQFDTEREVEKHVKNVHPGFHFVKKQVEEIVDGVKEDAKEEAEKELKEKSQAGLGKLKGLF
eukprot:TRINITY_DN21393_c0_g1_i1.p1 TRINITY_DN21393_c0_g1~~TRINITY_DN21393_c0_g1_i1.p1  ORF type:complete len:527 (+),score=125.95 TRINITY_DN21393_c0_g1_i1:106-1686(+)